MKAHLPSQGTKAQMLKAASERREAENCVHWKWLINEFCAQEYIIENGHSKVGVCPLLLAFLEVNPKSNYFFKLESKIRMYFLKL